MKHTRNKTEPSTKRVRNVTLYNTCDLSDAHHLECWTCELTLVMHSIVTMNLVTCYFRLTLLHGEYVACYITSLFQKVILLCNALLGVK